MNKKKAKLIFKHNYFDIIEEGDYILCAIKNNNADLMNVQRLNKRQLFQLAKDEILVIGNASPAESIFNVDSETKIIVRNYVKQMFPELS